MLTILRREFVYLWYYFTIQLNQIAPYWALGMVLGSLISVFGKEKIHHLFASIQNKRLGALKIVLGHKNFSLYLIYVAVFSLFTGILVDLIL